MPTDFLIESRRSALARPLVLAGLALLSACTSPELREPPIDPDVARAEIAQRIPSKIANRDGWAIDIFAAFEALSIRPTTNNICAVIAVTEQESTFRVDPVVPNLSAIAWKEIERQRDKLGIPSLVLKGALAIPSADGRSYGERIDAVKTEHELSDVFEEILDRVPLGRRLFAERNPVRTGGPMQVAIAFAQAHAKEKPYPYAVPKTIREEVFTRRGGLYFGIAHLLDYPASYDRYIYRFADYNAGRYASRNAAFQAALALVARRKLGLDGDLVPAGKARGGGPGETEAAALSIAKALDLDAADIRRDLAKEARADFESTALYRKVFELADRRAGKRVARAVVPSIELHTPKTSRRLTTRWFAERVAARQARCLNAPRAARGGAGAR